MNYHSWQTVSFHSNFRLSLGEGFPFQLLFKIKHVWNPRSHKRYFMCHTLAMHATNYFFVPVVKYRAFSFILSNAFSSTTFFFFFKERCSVKRKPFIHPGELWMGEPAMGTPPWDWSSFWLSCTFEHQVSVYHLDAFHFEHIWAFHWKAL